MAKKTRQSSAVETKPTKEFGFQVSTTAITHSINASRMRGSRPATFRRINDAESTDASIEDRFAQCCRMPRSVWLRRKFGAHFWVKCAIEAAALSRVLEILGSASTCP